MFVHMRYEQVKICPISGKGGVDKFLFEEAFVWSTAYLLNSLHSASNCHKWHLVFGSDINILDQLLAEKFLFFLWIQKQFGNTMNQFYQIT